MKRSEAEEAQKKVGGHIAAARIWLPASLLTLSKARDGGEGENCNSRLIN